MSSLPTASQPCAALQTLDLGSLAQYFHLRINDVARRLGVCATVLKKVCRKHGIPRWPQRKLASIDRRISLLKKPRRRLGTKEAKRIQLEIDFLLGQRQLLMKDPAAVMGSSAHEDSKCPFEQEIVFSDDNDNDNDNDNDDSDDCLDDMKDSPNKNGPLREATHIDVVFPVAKNENTHPSRMLDTPSVSASASVPAPASFYHFKVAQPATHGPSQGSNGSLLRRTNGLGGGAMMMKNLSSDSLASLHSNISGRSASSLQYTSESSSALDALVTVASMTAAPVPVSVPVSMSVPVSLAPVQPPQPEPLPLVHPNDVRLPVLLLTSSNPQSSVQSEGSEEDDDDEEEEEDEEGKGESDLRFASILRRCGAHVCNAAADSN